MRGPGDLLGTRQAGLPPLRVARLPEDWDGWSGRGTTPASCSAGSNEPGLEAAGGRGRTRAVHSAAHASCPGEGSAPVAVA